MNGHESAPGVAVERWWDGLRWTDACRAHGAASPPGLVADAAGDPPPGWYPDPYAASAAPTANKRRRGVLVGVGVLGLLGIATTALLVLGRGDDDVAAAPTTTISPGLLPPTGALLASRGPGLLAADSGEAVRISAASCGGLRAAIEVDQCTETTAGDLKLMMTSRFGGDRLEAKVYTLDTSATDLLATPVLGGSILAGNLQDGDRSELRIGSLESPTGPVLFLQNSTVTGDAPSTVEFVQLTPNGQASVMAVVPATSPVVTTRDGKIFVQGDDPADTNLIRLSTLYPLESGWQIVSEAFDGSTFDAASVNDSSTRLGEAVVLEVDAPTSTTPVQVPTTAATPSADAVALTRIAQLIETDRATAETLVGWYVPQLSAKYIGLTYKGVTYGPVQILAEHERLRRQYGAILVDAGSFQFTNNNQPMTGWFLSVVPVIHGSNDEADYWCDYQGIPAADCFGRLFKPPR